MALVSVSGLRVGMVVVDTNGAVCRVEDGQLLPPTPVQLMVALTLRNLETGAIYRVFRASDVATELVTLQEDQLECLYLTDSGGILFDPESTEQYEVPHWVGHGIHGGLQAGQRFIAGFWKGRPITLRLVQAEANEAHLSRLAR